jgi:hypothetical protein
MSYHLTWHRDYAAECIKGHDQFGEDADYFFAKFIIECGQGAELARKAGELAGSEKIVSIADTVLSTIRESDARGARCRSRITGKQAHALAVALLERYESARGIGAAIWGLTLEEIEKARR